eukprot:3560386-Heterocapsa_arctica.AAC.1
MSLYDAASWKLAIELRAGLPSSSWHGGCCPNPPARCHPRRAQSCCLALTRHDSSAFAFHGEPS